MTRPRQPEISAVPFKPFSRGLKNTKPIMPMAESKFFSVNLKY